MDIVIPLLIIAGCVLEIIGVVKTYATVKSGLPELPHSTFHSDTQVKNSASWGSDDIEVDSESVEDEINSFIDSYNDNVRTVLKEYRDTFLETIEHLYWIVAGFSLQVLAALLQLVYALNTLCS